MKLVICAQDIQSIIFGLVGEGDIPKEVVVETQPEGYLQALDDTLKTWGILPTALHEILVVSGPGSFTSSRVSTTIANSLAFAQGIPIRGIENPQHLPLRELLSKAASQQETHVVPSYDRPANITQKKKSNGDNKAD